MIRRPPAKKVNRGSHRLCSEQIKRFRILSDSWTAETGELTTTLKLRRRVVLERHSEAIDDLYG